MERETVLVSYTIIAVIVVWLKWDAIIAFLRPSVEKAQVLRAARLATMSSADDEEDTDQVRSAADFTANERTNEPANLGSSALGSRTAAGTGSFALNLTNDDLVGVQRLIQHRAIAEKPTKASAIYAAFGVSKGDSPRYRRASMLYDAFFGSTPAKPELDLQQVADNQFVRADIAH